MNRIHKNQRIRREWADCVLAGRLPLAADPRDPTLVHATGPIAEREGRVLRVVHDRSETPYRVVTVFFDGRLRP